MVEVGTTVIVGGYYTQRWRKKLLGNYRKRRLLGPTVILGVVICAQRTVGPRKLWVTDGLLCWCSKKGLSPPHHCCNSPFGGLKVWWNIAGLKVWWNIAASGHFGTKKGVTAVVLQQSSPSILQIQLKIQIPSYTYMHLQRRKHGGTVVLL